MTSQLAQAFSLGSVDIHPAAGLVADAAGTRRLQALILQQIPQRQHRGLDPQRYRGFGLNLE